MRLEPRECRRALTMASRAGLPHNQARLVFQQQMVDLVAARLADRLGIIHLGPAPAELARIVER